MAFPAAPDFYQEIVVFGRGLWYITAFYKKEGGAI